MHGNINNKLDLFRHRLRPNKKEQGILKENFKKFQSNLDRFYKGNMSLLKVKRIVTLRRLEKTVIYLEDGLPSFSHVSSSKPEKVNDPQSLLKDIRL